MMPQSHHIKKPLVLITGASGLLGSTLTPFLEAAGYRVARHGHQRQSDFNCDLTRARAARELLAQTRPDILINLIALSDVDRCEREPDRAFEINVKIVENLVSSFDQGKNPVFIHISTDQVYHLEGLSREADIHLTNTYARTKYKGEIKAASVPCVILRTNFFGPSRLPGRLSFSDWIIRALKGKEKITGFTDIVFNPVTMATLCRIMEQVMNNPVPGIFNVGSRGAMTKAGFILHLAQIYGLDASRVCPGKSTDMAQDAFRPKDMSMDCTLFESAYHMRLPLLKNEINSIKGIDNENQTQSGDKD